MSMDRRTFLHGLGAGALGLSSLSLGRPARAADTGPVRRLLVVSTTHGSIDARFRIRTTGLADDTPWELDLTQLPDSSWSQILAPLKRHASQLVVLEGLSLATAELDAAGFRHGKGWVHAWTGHNIDASSEVVASLGPSIDQVVASHVARADRLPSLELAVGPGRPIVHGASGRPLPLEVDPARVWSRLFASRESSPRRSAALAFAAAEADRLAPRLSTDDRQRLEAHFDLVSQLDGRLTGLAEASCPGRPDASDVQVDLDAYQDTLYAHAELVTAAFACDLTRVASISLSDLDATLIGLYPPGGDLHIGWAHQIYASSSALGAMSRVFAHHATQLATILDLLGSTPDPQGGSLLDHTLVVWGSELADGWHGYRDYNVVLAGGSWAWPTGRYLHWPRTDGPIEVLTNLGMRSAGVPHQHLLTSIAQAFGVPVEAVGLETVTSLAGDRIDLKGPLQGLTAGL